MTLIKICGIRDAEFGYYASKKGADWVGIVFYKGSRRYVEPANAKEICLAIREGGGKVVAVCSEIIPTGLFDLPIDGIQADIPIVRTPEHYINFYANFTPLAHQSGYVLYDNVKGGMGLQIPVETIIPSRHFPWFLAGGLNAQNVQGMIKQFNPAGVDVSTGVERNGTKDKALIREFINKVRNDE